MLEWIKSAWRGEAKLWHVFWLAGLAIKFTVFALDYLMFRSGGDLFAALLFMTASIGGSIFWWVSVWRCAYNVSWRPWGHISRGVVIFQIVIASIVTFWLGGAIMNSSTVASFSGYESTPATTYQGYGTIR